MSIFRLLALTPKASTAVITLWLLSLFCFFLSTILTQAQGTLSTIASWSFIVSCAPLSAIPIGSFYEIILWFEKASELKDKTINFPVLNKKNKIIQNIPNSIKKQKTSV